MSAELKMLEKMEEDVQEFEKHLKERKEALQEIDQTGKISFWSKILDIQQILSNIFFYELMFCVLKLLCVYGHVTVAYRQ